MSSTYFEFTNKIGKIVRCDIESGNDDNLPLLIFAHGFKGFRNWGFIPYVCSKFAEAGSICVRLDFSMNGIIDDVNQKYDDEVFRKNTVSREVSDLSELIEKFISNQLGIENFHRRWNGDVFLVGHSLGAAVSVLTAKKFQSITKISLWASVSQLNRNTDRQKEIWKQNGSIEILINTTGQKLHLDYTYIEDKESSFENNAIINELKKLNYPVQIIHPKNDMTVNIKEAEELKSTASDIRKRELIVIEKSGHTFNSRHPFSGTNDALESAIKHTINFFDLLK